MERPERVKLSKAEQRALHKKVTPDNKERDSNSQGLPVISEDLRLNLLRFLNLDGDANERREQAQLNNEAYYPPFLLATQVLQDEVGTLWKSYEPQVAPIKGWLSKNFTINLNAANCAAVGIGLVLKAYHMIYGEKFVDSFGQISPDDVLRILDEETKILEERFNIFNIATRRYQIPAHQFNLLFCLSELSFASPIPQAVIDGGTAMFKVLERNSEIFNT